MEYLDSRLAPSHVPGSPTAKPESLSLSRLSLQDYQRALDDAYYKRWLDLLLRPQQN